MHDPITLSGFVGQDGGTVTTTELSIAMIFFTPHKTIDEIPIMLTVAVGPGVSIDYLIGLLFLKGAKATIDLEAHYV